MAGSAGRIQQIQEEIARQSAQPEEQSGEGQAVLAFLLAGEEYAFPLSVVREVSRVGPITALPGLPPTVLGALGLRGEILPVLDLRRLLGLESTPPTPASRLIVVQEGTTAAALLVDQVGDIAVLEGALSPPPADASGQLPPFLQAVAREGNRLTRLLDLARLLEAVRHGG